MRVIARPIPNGAPAIRDGAQINPKIGALSALEESGGQGPGIISAGIGDKGGKSYCVYQLSLKEQTLPEFIRSPEGRPWAVQLQANKPGSPEFDKIWKLIGANDVRDFRDAQHKFIQRTILNR